MRGEKPSWTTPVNDNISRNSGILNNKEFPEQESNLLEYMTLMTFQRSTIVLPCIIILVMLLLDKRRFFMFSAHNTDCDREILFACIETSLNVVPSPRKITLCVQTGKETRKGWTMEVLFSPEHYIYEE